MTIFGRMKAFWSQWREDATYIDQMDTDSHLTRTGQALPENVARQAIPRVGERWRRNDGDPFPPKTFAVILDVQAEWVRYRIGNTFPNVFDDERLPLATFVQVYRPFEP